MKLRNLLVFGAALGLSLAAYAATDEQATPANDQTAAAAPANTAEPAKASKSETMEKVNINTADAKELAKVKGVGIKKAKAIVKYRTKGGEFKDLDGLLKVKGINKKWLDKVSSRLTV